jgi:hypothetical protein
VAPGYQGAAFAKGFGLCWTRSEVRVNSLNGRTAGPRSTPATREGRIALVSTPGRGEPRADQAPESASEQPVQAPAITSLSAVLL